MSDDSRHIKIDESLKKLSHDEILRLGRIHDVLVP